MSFTYNPVNCFDGPFMYQIYAKLTHLCTNNNCQYTEITGYPCFHEGIPQFKLWRLSAVRSFWHFKFLCPSLTTLWIALMTLLCTKFMLNWHICVQITAVNVLKYRVTHVFTMGYLGLRCTTKCSTTILPLQVLVSFTYNPVTCLDDCFMYQNMLNWHIPLHK